MSNATPFKWRQFESEIMLLCVRWYLRVRHVTDFSILPQAERTGRRFFGSTAYLASKDNGNKSMLVKQGVAKAL
jgi:hypothetical protein